MGKTSSHRIAYLDGIRGLAIFFVVMGHLRTNERSLFSAVDDYIPDSGFGLRIFFVLSGFLITMLLRRDPPGQNPLTRLKNFYRRRFFKLVPPLILYVGVVTLLDRLTIKTCGVVPAISALFFLTAFRLRGNFPDHCFELVHTWSLTIEEVFYVAWAPIIIFFRRRITVPLAILAIVAAPPLEVITWANDHGRFQSWFGSLPSPRFFLNFGYLGMGALLAELLVSDFWRRRQPGVPNLRRWLGAVASTAVVFHTLVHYVRWPVLTLPFINLVDAAFFAGLILFCVANPQGTICRMLSWAPLRTLGVISYSLYLWQQLFTRYTPAPNYTYPWQQWPVSVGLALATGFLSYYFIERNIVKLSRKYASPDLTLSQFRSDTNFDRATENRAKAA